MDRLQESSGIAAVVVAGSIHSLPIGKHANDLQAESHAYGDSFLGVHEERDGDSLGFMEFFDWLAGTTKEELRTLATSIVPEGDERFAALGALGMDLREQAGLIIWRYM